MAKKYKYAIFVATRVRSRYHYGMPVGFRSTKSAAQMFAKGLEKRGWKTKLQRFEVKK